MEAKGKWKLQYDIRLWALLPTSKVLGLGQGFCGVHVPLHQEGRMSQASTKAYQSGPEAVLREDIDSYPPGRRLRK